MRRRRRRRRRGRRCSEEGKEERLKDVLKREEVLREEGRGRRE